MRLGREKRLGGEPWGVPRWGGERRRGGGESWWEVILGEERILGEDERSEMKVVKVKESMHGYLDDGEWENGDVDEDGLEMP